MDSKDQLIELLKEKYSHEMSRKHKFDDVLSLPVTVLSLVVAGIFYILNEVYSKQLSTCVKSMFIAIVGVLLIVSIFSILSLIFVFFGYKREYCTFPDSDSVFTSYNELEEYYKEENTEKDKLISKILKDYTIKWYLECNSHNMKTNDRRAAAYHNFKLLFSFIVILGLILMFIVFYLKVR